MAMREKTKLAKKLHTTASIFLYGVQSRKNLTSISLSIYVYILVFYNFAHVSSLNVFGMTSLPTIHYLSVINAFHYRAKRISLVLGISLLNFFQISRIFRCQTRKMEPVEQLRIFSRKSCFLKTHTREGRICPGMHFYYNCNTSLSTSTSYTARLSICFS